MKIELKKIKHTEYLMNAHDTREGWLKTAMALLDQEFFAGRGHELPKQLKCGCAPIKGKPKAIGVCWDKTCSTNGTYEMFICGSQDEPVRVLDILLHEMIHAEVGIEQGHKGEFRKRAKSFGLEGKMTATYVTEGTELWLKLKEIADTLGPYPHSAMQFQKKPSKQKTRLVYVSPENDKFRAVMKADVIEEFGPPKDPWGNDMKRLGGEDDDEEGEEE